jgi:hypothetical protein
VHAPTKYKDDDRRTDFTNNCNIFDKFPKYHTNILPESLNGKVGKEDIFKLKIAYESLHKARNDNGVRVVTSETSKYVICKSTIFHTATFMNTFGLLLTVSQIIR